MPWIRNSSLLIVPTTRLQTPALREISSAVILHTHTQKQKSKAIPLQAWSGPEGSKGRGSQISRQSVHEGGKVVSPTQWPPLHPRKYSWYSFLL